MDKFEFKYKDDDIRQHLNMQQDIINRMANNSSNCKAWLITIVAALSALQITQETIHNYGWLLLVITLMFWYLDAFYLALERIHRHNEEKFVEELNNKYADNKSSLVDKIYKFSTRTDKNKFKLTLNAMCSASCLPFYCCLIFLIVCLSWGDFIVSRITCICCC